MELYLEISSFASAGDFLEGFFAPRCKNLAIKSFDCRYAFDFFGAYINVNCNRQSIYRIMHEYNYYMFIVHDLCEIILLSPTGS